MPFAAANQPGATRPPARPAAPATTAVPAPVRTTTAAPAPAPAPAPARTTAAAPAPPASSNCDPAYPDVCLEDGKGDYDCAGGSGNGPNYVRGPVRVLAPDPFGLDADGDGVGCQS
ncbi:excalibur domain-containing protein [Pseudofrankia saprophytica]|uniref:excalibur domain-containing protein n=1 Tax=Pseudofrankia saprophytica TaxID=298655 RepID=UPI0002F7486E|nr:excalibur domain-containing protein [Pseudofrankia saprophytica]